MSEEYTDAWQYGTEHLSSNEVPQKYVCNKPPSVTTVSTEHHLLKWEVAYMLICESGG